MHPFFWVLIVCIAINLVAIWFGGRIRQARDVQAVREHRHPVPDVDPFVDEEAA